MIPVVCAIICRKGELLIVQHGMNSHHPLKWEFPGGKVNPGEDHVNALIREIDEELKLRIEIEESLEPVVYDYGTKIIRLIPFLCTLQNSAVVLNEHADFRWIIPEKLSESDLLPADRLIFENQDNYRRIIRFLEYNV